MKPTRPICVTGNRNWQYVKAGQSTVAQTFKRVKREYAQAWDDAHAENSERNAAERAQKVSQIKPSKGAAK